MVHRPTRARDIKVRRFLKSRRMDVRREEFNRVIDQLNERAELLDALRRNQEIQFQRIAQIQAEIDQLKRK
jgi:hypothetical protein